MNIAIKSPVTQPTNRVDIAEIAPADPQGLAFANAFLRFSVQVLDDALQRATASDVLPPLTYSFEEQVAAEYVAANPAKLEPFRQFKPEGAAQSTIDALVYEARSTGTVRVGALSQLSKKQRGDVVQRLHALRGKYPKITDALIVRIGRGN